MTTVADLIEAISAVVTPAGFARRRTSWYWQTDDVIQVVNLQKSRWGNQYYLNFGVWLLPLGKSKAPLESKCHIRWRIDELPRARRTAELLDLERPLPDAERSAKLRRIMQSVFLRFSQQCASCAGLKQLWKSGSLEDELVTWPAQRYLARR